VFRRLAKQLLTIWHGRNCNHPVSLLSLCGHFPEPEFLTFQSSASVVMANVLPNLSSANKKRRRVDSDDEYDSDDSEMMGEMVKRKKNTNTTHSSNSIDLDSGDVSTEDEFMPIMLGEEMMEETEEEAAKRAKESTEGDTSNWTLEQLIKTRVVGSEPFVRRSTDTNGGMGGAGRLGSILPTVRASVARSNVPPAVPLDTDPALNLYSEEPFAVQVMIGADGRIIVDSATQVIPQTQEPESGPRTVVDGSRTHITSATYAKRPRSERWSAEEVELLYEAIEYCGTDFSMIEVYFPTRTRAHVKARFKKEEKEQPTRIAAAIKARKKIDIEEFKRLLAIKRQAGKPTASASATPSTTSRVGTRAPSQAQSTANSPPTSPRPPASLSTTMTMTSPPTSSIASLPPTTLPPRLAPLPASPSPPSSPHGSSLAYPD
jgi:hypothetical protein